MLNWWWCWNKAKMWRTRLALIFQRLYSAYAQSNWMMQESGPMTSSPRSLSRRPLDALYIVFFVSHLVFSLALDTQALFPKGYFPAALQQTLDYFLTITNDPLFRYGPKPWFKAFLWLELLFQCPVFVLGIIGLGHGAFFSIVCLLERDSTASGSDANHGPIFHRRQADMASSSCLRCACSYYDNCMSRNSACRSARDTGTANNAAVFLRALPRYSSCESYSLNGHRYSGLSYVFRCYQLIWSDAPQPS